MPLARRLDELLPGETPEEVQEAMERLSPDERAEAAEIIAQVPRIRYAWPN